MCLILVKFKGAVFFRLPNMAGFRPGFVPLKGLFKDHLAKWVATQDLKRSVGWISFSVDQMDDGVMTQGKFCSVKVSYNYALTRHGNRTTKGSSENWCRFGITDLHVRCRHD